MFFGLKKTKAQQSNINQNKDVELACEQELKAIKRHTAFISFSSEGYIIDANDLFLKATGYQLNEIIGKHHRVFCTDSYAQSESYKSFWSQLSSGHSHEGTFERRKKDGSLIYLEASYFPVLTDSGTVKKIIKIASDITEAQAKLQDKESLFQALDR